MHKKETAGTIFQHLTAAALNLRNEIPTSALMSLYILITIIKST